MDNTVTISSKYQVVIQRSIREQFNLSPGQKIAFIPYKNTLRVIIVPPIEAAEGLFEGIDTEKKKTASYERSRLFGLAGILCQGRKIRKPLRLLSRISML